MALDRGVPSGLKMVSSMEAAGRSSTAFRGYSSSKTPLPSPLFRLTLYVSPSILAVPR